MGALLSRATLKMYVYRVLRYMLVYLLPQDGQRKPPMSSCCPGDVLCCVYVNICT